MTGTSGIHHGGCHCGQVRFALDLPGGFDDVERCNCSLCQMKGIVMLGVPLASFTLTKGKNLLSLYQFNTGEAEHWFCSICGIYTHHKRRSDPGQYAVNAACIDTISPLDFLETNVIDGRNHPNDNDGKWSIAGVMRYEPARRGP